MEPAAAQGLHQRPLSHYDATMSTQAILLDDRIEQLAEQRERRAVPFGGLGLEARDGFFSALAVAPDGIAEAQRQAAVGGGPTPRWKHGDEARAAAALRDRKSARTNASTQGASRLHLSAR